MRTEAAGAVLLAASIGLASTGQAGERFVSKQGSDANTGESWDAAFLTIRKGVNALKPGDTLTVGPGEYLENITLHDFGDSGRQTLIRAAFFVLRCSDVAVSLTARLAAADAEAAETLEMALARPATRAALKNRIAQGVGLELTRDAGIVTLEASVDLNVFDRLIVADATRRKTDPTRSTNLLIFLLED